MSSIIHAMPDNNSYIFCGNKKVTVLYEFVPLSSIQPSHFCDGTKNPNYNQKLQNRELRGSAVDILRQKQRALEFKPEHLGMATNLTFGAPILNDEMQVLAGNGRYIIFCYADDEKYAEYLLYMKSLGFVPPSDATERHILIRKALDATTETQMKIAWESNQTAIDLLDHASQACEDSKLLPRCRDYMDFYHALPTEEQTRYQLVNDIQSINKLAVSRRYQDALFSWFFYGDSLRYEKLYLGKALSSKLVNSLHKVLPDIYDYEKDGQSASLRQKFREMIDKNGGDFSSDVYQKLISAPLPLTAGPGSEVFMQNFSFLDAALLFAVMLGGQNEITEFLTSYLDKIKANKFGNLFADGHERLQSEVVGYALKQTFPDHFSAKGTPESPIMRLVHMCPFPVLTDEIRELFAAARQKIKDDNEAKFLENKQKADLLNLRKRISREVVTPLTTKIMEYQLKHPYMTLHDIYNQMCKDPMLQVVDQQLSIWNDGK